MHIEPRALAARIRRLRDRIEDESQHKMLTALLAATESLDFYSRKTNYGRIHKTLGMRLGSPSSVETDGGRKASNALLEIHRVVSELERDTS